MGATDSSQDDGAFDRYRMHRYTCGHYTDDTASWCRQVRNGDPVHPLSALRFLCRLGSVANPDNGAAVVRTVGQVAGLV